MLTLDNFTTAVVEIYVFQPYRLAASNITGRLLLRIFYRFYQCLHTALPLKENLVELLHPICWLWEKFVSKTILTHWTNKDYVAINWYSGWNSNQGSNLPCYRKGVRASNAERRSTRSHNIISNALLAWTIGSDWRHCANSVNGAEI